MPRLTDFIFCRSPRNGARTRLFPPGYASLSRESENRVSITDVDRCVRMQILVPERRFRYPEYDDEHQSYSNNVLTFERSPPLVITCFLIVDGN